MNLDSGPRKDFPRTEWTIGHRVRKKQSFQHEVKGEVKKSVTLYGPRSSGPQRKAEADLSWQRNSSVSRILTTPSQIRSLVLQPPVLVRRPPFGISSRAGAKDRPPTSAAADLRP